MSLRKKGGRYYLVKYTGLVNGKSHYQWTALTKDLQSSTLMAAKINNNDIRFIGASMEETMPELRKFIAKAYRSCLRRSAESGRDADITLEDVMALAEQNEWRCSVTGVKFDLRQLNKSHGRPFAPSIDRIDSTKGYTKGNIRVVCLAANYAMNQWGEDVLVIMLTSFKKKRGLNKRAMIEAELNATESIGHGKPSHEPTNSAIFTPDCLSVSC